MYTFWYYTVIYHPVDTRFCFEIVYVFYLDYFKLGNPRIEIQSPTSDETEGSLVRDSVTPSSVSPSPSGTPHHPIDVSPTRDESHQLEQNRTRDFTINQYNRMGVQVG